MPARTAEEEPRDAAGARIPWGAVAAAVAVALAWLALAARCSGFYAVGTFNDDACYVVQARALAHGGSVLRMAGDPRHRPSPYPPGHAILLAPLAALCGDRLAPLQGLDVAFMLAAGVAFGLLAARALGPWIGVLLGAAFLFSPGPLTYAATLMSDVSFTALVGIALLCAEGLLGTQYGVGAPFCVPNRPSARLAAPAALGALAGFAVLVRIPGVVLVASILAVLALRRRWRELGGCAVGAALPVIPYLVLSGNASGGGYLAQARAHFPTAGALLAHLTGWWGAFPTALARVFLGLDAAWAGALLLALAAVGIVLAWRRDGARVWLVFAPAYVIFYMLWPYMDARFYLPLWPLLLLGAARAVPRPAAAVLLLAVLGATLQAAPRIATVSAERAAAHAEAWSAYGWLRDHTAPGDVVMAPYAFRAYMLGGRPSVQAPGASQWGALLAAACEEDAGWLLIEPRFNSSQDLQGQNMVGQPKELARWMDASTLVRLACDGGGERVYRRTVDGAAFGRAFAAYQLAGSIDWRLRADLAERALRQATREVADFPEAKSQLALLLLQTGRGGDEAIRLLEGVVRQYPMDVPSAANLGQALMARGETARARTVLQAARAEALRQDARPQLLFIEGLLQQMR